MTMNGYITTGLDIADETRAFNAGVAELLSTQPALEDVDDAPALRAAREEGRSVFPTPVRVAEATTRTVPGRAGGVPVRVFRPDDVRGVYLHIHGGGWTLGSADSQDPLLLELARAANVAVVSVDYRLAPEHPYPAGPDDCEDAARWLLAEAAAEFGTGRLVIGGESAGAHLAVVTLLRLGGQASAFAGAQLTFGAYDLAMTPSQRHAQDMLVIPKGTMAWFYDQFLPGMGPEERRAPDVSPLYADLRGMPHARFSVGTQDPLLDDSLFMAARWSAAGNEAELEVVAEALHGFVAFPDTAGERERAAQVAYIAGRVAGKD
ncbi:alpha/beta hydrolase [Actinomadura sp. 9N407]|uniref:alpha/beta hydrolase n=1 Tax=Actinomadura sp. 9N407 TaxID=3375154 RepID=UPI0037B04484